MIPHSKHSFQTAKPKKKVVEPEELSPLSDWEYQLSKGWEMIEGYKARAAEKTVFAQDLGTSEWYSATVPGTVLTTLVDQGVYPDPYWGLNNLLIPDTLCRMDWWYRNSFSIPRSKKGEKVKLILNGINYKAEIWFNHQLLGTMVGAFERGIFDITPWVDYDKKNLLAIRILPPNNPGIPHEANKKEGIGPNGGALCLDGPTFISSEGWDWIPGIRDRNMGIWQDVRIKFGNELEIVDTHVITDLPLPDTTSVNFIVQTEIYNSSKTTCTANLHFNIGDVSAVYPVSLNANEKRMIKLTPHECKELQMKNPRLWWPNGYGEQYLYKASLSLISPNKDTLDVKKMRIGIRELEYELSAYEDNSPVVRLNYNPTAALQDGKPVFDAVKRKKTDSKVRYTNYDGEFVPNLLKPVSSQGIEFLSSTYKCNFLGADNKQ
ncbi:glycosyl hydrolase 2 galactose-binding domain-containing protein [Bacteroides ovatus]|uniref:glycosyl hydrolase 2 galactose-binding domain-containing protein n=1 Tax=Bacteroides ovatus TaxID=28116 RepID=UPI00293D5E9C|nr:sugar-binding domain-containing protein [Bacteroides ovatus]